MEVISTKILGSLILVESLINVYFSSNKNKGDPEKESIRNEVIFEVLFDILLHTGVYSMYSLQDAFNNRNMKISIEFVNILLKWSGIFVKAILSLPRPEQKDALDKLEEEKIYGSLSKLITINSNDKINNIIINMMLNPEFVELLSTLLFLGLPNPRLVFMSTIIKIDKGLIELKINICKILYTLVDYIPIQNIAFNDPDERGFKNKIEKEVYSKIKSSQSKTFKVNFILMNVFPDIIQNLIGLTRDSKFSVREAKNLNDVNTFNLLYNSSKFLSYLIFIDFTII